MSDTDLSALDIEKSWDKRALQFLQVTQVWPHLLALLCLLMILPIVSCLVLSCLVIASIFHFLLLTLSCCFKVSCCTLSDNLVIHSMFVPWVHALSICALGSCPLCLCLVFMPFVSLFALLCLLFLPPSSCLFIQLPAIYFHDSNSCCGDCHDVYSGVHCLIIQFVLFCGPIDNTYSCTWLYLLMSPGLAHLRLHGCSLFHDLYSVHVFRD